MNVATLCVMVAVLAAALVRTLLEAGKAAAEIRRLKDEVDALKIQLAIAARHVDADTAYDGLRKTSK